MAKFLLIDGHNLAFRSYFGIHQLARKDGFPVNAIYGWLKGLWKLQDQIQPDFCLVFFDLGHSQIRREMLAEYKAQRPPTPENFKAQLPHIKQVTPLLGIQVIEQKNIEADDLLASCAAQQKASDSIAIASSDKDFAQLLAQNNIRQFLPPSSRQQNWTEMTKANVVEKFGVEADQIVDFLSLTGDSADNIPGISGVGQKTAALWLKQFKSIEGIWENRSQLSPRFQALVNESLPLLQRNRNLITLNTSLQVPPIQQPRPQPEKLKAFLREFELPSFLRQVQNRYEGKVDQDRQFSLFSSLDLNP